MVALQHLLDASVESLDHAVGLRVLRRGQAMVNAEVAAQLVEVVLAGGGPFAQTEQAVGEFAAARHWARTNGAVNGSLGQHRANPHRAGPFQVTQKPAGIGGGLGFIDADEDPAGCPINGHKQIAPRVRRENCKRPA